MNTKRLWMSTAVALSMSMSIPTLWAADRLQPGGPASAPQHTTHQATRDMSDHPSERDLNIHSSVQVTRESLREAYMASRDAYTSKLQKYAKCTPAQAKKAVAAAHPGMKVQGVQLRNIRTNLVYVGITEDDEDRYLVIIDAGNGKVLLDKPLPTHQERVFAGSK